MAAMPARVGEGAQHAVVATDKQHAAPAGPLGPLVSRLRNLRTKPDARPAAGEEVLLFPGEDCGIDIRGPGQHLARAKGAEALCETGGVDGSSGDSRLTDHTVKSKQPPTACPARVLRSGVRKSPGSAIRRQSSPRSVHQAARKVYPPYMSTSPISPDDIRAAAEVHQELGPEYNDAVVASFLEKVDREIAARVEARLAGVARAEPAKQTNRRTPVKGMAIGAAAVAL